MNIKEATKLINELRDSTDYTEIYGGASNEPMNVALEIAVDSMQKQEAMKPVPLKYEPLILHGWEYGCPACEKAVGFNKYAVEYTDEDPFCPSCGQAIDWEG